VLAGPPNTLADPKPASSRSTTSTFGAPVGGRNGSIGGNDVSGSFASYVGYPLRWPVRDREDLTLELIALAHATPPGTCSLRRRPRATCLLSRRERGPASPRLMRCPRMGAVVWRPDQPEWWVIRVG
jgi:hypothetical protein